jgi:flagellar operon protein (TIGR03826 family)
MGELRNCPQCGKVFMYMVRNLCPACIDLEEKQYEEVKDYLQKNPGAQIEQIVEDTGVDESKVLRWMRDGRLVVADTGGRPVLVCQRCGRQVERGSLCPKCAQFLTEEINATKGGYRNEAADNKDPGKKSHHIARFGMHIRKHDGEDD